LWRGRPERAIRPVDGAHRFSIRASGNVAWLVAGAVRPAGELSAPRGGAALPGALRHRARPGGAGAGDGRRTLPRRSGGVGPGERDDEGAAVRGAATGRRMGFLLAGPLL